jgi:hypothetical protein
LAVPFKLVEEFVFADQSLNLLTLFFKVVGYALEGVVVPLLPSFEVRQIYEFAQILSR